MPRTHGDSRERKRGERKQSEEKDRKNCSTAQQWRRYSSHHQFVLSSPNRNHNQLLLYTYIYRLTHANLTNFPGFLLWFDRREKSSVSLSQSGCMARRAGKEPIINNQVQVQIINLNKQLLDRIRDLELRGLVDGHLRLCHSLKEENGLLFFVRLLPSFCIDASAVIEKMVAVVNQTVVDFKDLFEFCFKLEGSAGSVGAFRVSKACSNLRVATNMRSKHGCLLALNEIKYEFDALRTPLETIIQLERDIIRMENQNNKKSFACASSAPHTKF